MTRAELEQIAREAAAQYNLPVDVFLRLIQQESGFDPAAVSPKGAIGPAQLMPDTAKELGVNPNNVRENIFGGAKYLSQQLSRFGEMPLALAAYNAGPTRVARLGRIPNIPETQNYVKNILGSLNGQPLSATRNNAMVGNMQTPPIFPQQQQQRQGGLRGLLSSFMQPNQTTGLTGPENFAQALDALILPEARMGEQIRARGAQRLDKQRRNKTMEWLKSQEGGEVYAQAIEMGVPIGDVYSAYLKAQAGDYVVVGNTLVDRKTGKPIFTAPSTAQSQGTITLSDGTVIALGKQTDTQAGSMDFGSRMTFANEILENTEQLGTSLGEQFVSKIPLFGGAFTSPEFKQYDQARRTFVNAILRRESGAAIAESEFESANQQYFPQPFDPPEVIAQKRAARELATTMMLAASGPNATQYAKDQAAQFAKKLNPLYGTEEYNKQREELEKNTSSTTTAGGNERVNF